MKREFLNVKIQIHYFSRGKHLSLTVLWGSSITIQKHQKREGKREKHKSCYMIGQVIKGENF